MARILYVEDHPDLRFLYSSAFKAAGHEVTACDDYMSAQAPLKNSLTNQKPFDLIVSDGRYPGDDKRFTSGSHRTYDGSACLLHDHKLLGLTAPVVIISSDAYFLERHPYPSVCTQPLGIFSKDDCSPKRLAAEIPALLAKAAAPRL